MYLIFLTLLPVGKENGAFSWDLGPQPQSSRWVSRLVSESKWPYLSAGARASLQQWHLKTISHVTRSLVTRALAVGILSLSEMGKQTQGFSLLPIKHW